MGFHQGQEAAGIVRSHLRLTRRVRHRRVLQAPAFYPVEMEDRPPYGAVSYSTGSAPMSDQGFSEEEVAAYWNVNAGPWAQEVREGRGLPRAAAGRDAGLQHHPSLLHHPGRQVDAR